MIKVHCDIEDCKNAAPVDITADGTGLPLGWFTVTWDVEAAGEVTEAEKAIQDFTEQMKEKLGGELGGGFELPIGKPIDHVHFEAHVCDKCSSGINFSGFHKTGQHRVNTVFTTPRR